MDLDAEFAKRSEMRIYTHFALPDGVRGYSEGEFRGQFKGIKQKESAGNADINVNLFDKNLTGTDFMPFEPLNALR